MGGKTKAKAMGSAMRCIPMSGEGPAYRQRLEDFRTGYMAGHAACVRSTNKRILPFTSKAIEELRIVEREIGVPSEALKLWGCSADP